jgi:hypothetical protein
LEHRDASVSFVLRASISVGLVEPIDRGFAVRHASSERARCRRDNRERKEALAIWKPIAHNLQTTGVAESFKKGEKTMKKGSPRGLPCHSKEEKKLVFGFDSPAVRNFALVHAKAETAIRIRTNPSLEQHRSAFLSIVRQGNQRARVTLLALRPLHHPRLLSADPNRIARA